MKRYIITVNGQRYETIVEEKEGAANITKVTGLSAPAPAPTPAPTPTPTPAPAPATVPPSPAANKAAGPGTITAPMPGKVLAVKVKPGTQVQKGQVVVILEAMKMENEITASSAGTVKEVHVNDGASVNVGEPLVTIA